MLKWTLAQLFKFNNKQFNFSDTYDFHDYIQKIDDILDISIAKVEGYGKCVQDDRYLFHLHIECLLVLECARTLDSVNYPVDLEVDEIFDIDNQDDSNIRIIEKNTIDLRDIIWENIYLEKPMRIFKKGTTEFVNEENFDDFYDEES